MKELSIEEKACRYDESIKVAADIKAGTATYITDGTPVIEAIFPELKESEDEKIRKALIKYFTLSDDNADYQCCGVHCKDIVAWLKKQSGKKPVDVEQKPAEWSEEDENLLTDTEYLLRVVKMENRSDNEYQRAENCLAWLNSLRPQNKWEPSDLELDCLRLAAEKDGGTGLMGLYNKLCNLKGIGHGERQSKYMA